MNRTCGHNVVDKLRTYKRVHYKTCVFDKINSVPGLSRGMVSLQIFKRKKKNTQIDYDVDGGDTRHLLALALPGCPASMDGCLQSCA